MMNKRMGSVALRLVAVAVTGSFAFWGVRWREVADSVRNVDGILLALVVAMNASMMALKAARLRLLLGARKASFAFCFLALLTSSAINNVSPLRGGDVARLWMLSRNAGITKTAAIGVTVVEKLVDLLSLAVLIIVVYWFFPTQQWAKYAASIVLAGSAALLVTLSVTTARGPRIGRPEPDTPRGWGGLRCRVRALGARFAPGVTPLTERGVFAQAVVLSILAWGCEVVMVTICARSLGTPIGLALGPSLLLGINLAMVVPSAPAGAGPFEGATVVILSLAGVAKGPALAFALVYHAIQVVPVTIAGLAVVSHLGIALSGSPKGLAKTEAASDA